MAKKSVAVIGAGVSGITAAKYVKHPLKGKHHTNHSSPCKTRRLRAEGLSVRVFERALGPGGVWSYNCNANAPFATPMYDPLETNYPRELMEFADHPWPADTPLYPSHRQVMDYLCDYSKGVEVEYGTEVVDVFKRTPRWPRRWCVTIQKRDSEDKTPIEFDAVVICIGTFDKPFMPEHEGLTEWEKAYPDSVLHSKTFRNVNSYRGKARI
ncbi:hypothetical protein PG984_004919 [Apiospora sp. TS-2023a]